MPKVTGRLYVLLVIRGELILRELPLDFKEVCFMQQGYMHYCGYPVLRVLCRATCQSLCHQSTLLVIEKLPQHKTKKCEIICQGGVLKVWYKLQVQWKIRAGKTVSHGASGKGKVGFGMHAGQAINKHLLHPSQPSASSVYPPLSSLHLENILKSAGSLSLVDCKWTWPMAY